MQLSDIYHLALTCRDERDLNVQLLLLMGQGDLRLDVYLEYLEVTQGEVVQCLHAALNPEDEAGE